MREKIQRSLFILGVVAVVVTFIMAAILYYQGMQDQHTRELRMITYTASQALSEDQQDEGRAYLEKMFIENSDGIHLAWITPDGDVLYDSRANNEDEEYMKKPEVKEGFEKGESFSIHKDANGGPKEYYTHVTRDGKTLFRISSNRGVSWMAFSHYFPEIILFVLTFAVGCFIIAVKLTSSILKPLESLDSFIGGLMEGEKNKPIPGGYNELTPLVNKVKEQSEQIDDYLKDIEEDRNTIRTIVDTISDGIILLNENKEIIDYNSRIEELFNFTNNYKYRKIASLYHNEDWLRAISRAYHDGKRTSYTMTLFEKPYRVILTPVSLLSGQSGLLIVLRDQSAQYAAEQMRREFSANVSHELKTPLTSISGFAEMIANGMYQNEEDVKHFGTRIFEESHRMLSLIDTLLHLSKLEENDTTITWTTVNMEDVVKYVADIIQPLARKKNITVTIETEPVYVHGNQPLLSELVLNLVDNAVKYNVEGGSIHIRLAHDEKGEMALSVSDTGIGIPKDQQQRVFERFYRTDKSRNKATGGTGLGLAIVKHIVTRHKGRLAIASEEGKGTTITITMAAMNEAEVHLEENDARAAQQEAERVEEEAKKAREEAEAKEKQEAEEKAKAEAEATEAKKTEETVEDKEDKEKKHKKKKKKDKDKKKKK